MTNTRQPAEMGMISSIEVGYKATLIEQLLSIFDIEGGYLREYDKRDKKIVDAGALTLVGSPICFMQC